MKKLFIILAFALLFAGCSQGAGSTPAEISGETTGTATTVPATENSDKPYYVKNSAWQNVDINTLKTARETVPSLDEALAIVADYNAENNGDQLHLDTVDIPITEAPDVTVYYAKAVGQFYEIGEQYTVSRAFYAQYSQMYTQDAASRGYIVFVEKVPETVPVVVVIPDTRTRHEKYAIYVVNKYDKIASYGSLKYEMHVDDLWDSLDAETQAGYKNNIDNLMNWYITAYTSDASVTTYVDAPWRVVSGQLYTEPADPPVEP